MVCEREHKELVWISPWSLPFRVTSFSHLSTFQSFARCPVALEVGGIWYT